MERSPEDARNGASWATGIAAITLFIEDLTTAKQFYRQVFGFPIFFEDNDSAVFKFGTTLVNLLKRTAAGELVEPAKVGKKDTGPDFVLTIGVDDVDAVCSALTTRGIQLLNGPMDRPWGVRTASFQDPDGYIWEIAR